MARKSSSKSKGGLYSLISFLVTVATGAGISGWTYPSTPIVGPLVQYLLNTPVAEQAGNDHPELKQQLEVVADGITKFEKVLQGSGASANPASATPAANIAPTGYQPPEAPAPQAVGHETIAIASFNIQVLGPPKLAKPGVADVLADIIRHFDLVAVQEVRTQDDNLVPQLLQYVNAQGAQYHYVIGPRLGRTVSKEQYVFIYNTARLYVEPTSVATMLDPSDLLHREPLIAHFRVRLAPPAQGFSFWIANTHTDPDEVPQEVDALADAFQAIQQSGWGEDDVILLGDLNASEHELGRLGQIPYIVPAIRGVATNTRGTKSYDNILFSSAATTEFMGQAGVLNMASQYRLTMEQALQISDHNPVWAVFSAFEGGAQVPVANRPGTRR